MKTEKYCQGCHAVLAADAPQGLCPACLMKAAMATGTADDQEAPSFVPPSIEELAPKFPQLEIVELLGRGGMGAVYKARQKELDRWVALKILPPGAGRDAAFADRFAREAKALAKLNHPGIVTIHDFGRADGLYFFLMEYVDGVNLRQLLNTSRVSPREALAIVPQICDALQFAHDQGIVHRDIKPENILLDRRGRVKVADFGVAKIIANEAEEQKTNPKAPIAASLTGAGSIMGTPQYMSPEQIQAPGEVDHRSDIYALGVVLYQMLTGELPDKQLQPPSSKVHIDVRLDEVVLRALERKPERRYQQASALKTELETIAESTQQPHSTSPGRAPAALKIVAVFFIAIGIWSLPELLLGSTGSLRIVPGVFALPIGIGLLNRRETCRRIAIWFTALSFFGLVGFVGWTISKSFGLLPHSELVAQISGKPIQGGLGAMLALAMLVSFLVMLPWMYIVLRREDVRAAFNVTPKRGAWLERGAAVLGLLAMIPALQLHLHNPLSFGIEIRDRRNQPDSAALSTWTPQLAPGEKPDLQKIRDEIQSSMNTNDYEGALQRQLWYFNHAAEYGEVDAIRLTFGIMHWKELSRRYPKARQALVEIRDKGMREFAKGGGYAALFFEVKAIDGLLGEEEATYRLFKSIEKRDPDLARQIYPYAEEVLVQHSDYATCLKYLGDAQARFKQIRDIRQNTTSLLDRFPSGMPATQGNMRRQADDMFTRNTLTLIQILAGAGREEQAEQIRKQALEVVNDPRLQAPQPKA